MYKRLSLLLVLFGAILTLSSALSWAHEAGWPGKRLAEVFPKAKNFKARQVTLIAEQIARIEKATGSKIGAEEKSPTFYVAYGVDEGSKSDEIKLIGAVIFIDAVGERGKMEVNVAVSPKGTLHAISLWKNKEAKQLGSKEFLKQFNEEKKPTDPFRVGEDITPVPDAEKASQAVATAAKKGWLMSQEVFGKKKTEEASAESASQDTKGDDHQAEEQHDEKDERNQ